MPMADSQSVLAHKFVLLCVEYSKNHCKVRFVPETVRVDRLLKSFQKARDLVVVVDEYGVVSGVVTLEDVLEVLTGEIVDETDRIIDLQAIARKKLEKMLQIGSFKK
jgi:CBS domain containing-hemolysin-like protein